MYLVFNETIPAKRKLSKLQVYFSVINANTVGTNIRLEFRKSFIPDLHLKFFALENFYYLHLIFAVFIPIVICKVVSTS